MRPRSRYRFASTCFGVQKRQALPFLRDALRSVFFLLRKQTRTILHGNPSRRRILPAVRLCAPLRDPAPDGHGSECVGQARRADSRKGHLLRPGRKSCRERHNQMSKPGWLEALAPAPGHLSVPFNSDAGARPATGKAMASAAVVDTTGTAPGRKSPVTTMIIGGERPREEARKGPDLAQHRVAPSLRGCRRAAVRVLGMNRRAVRVLELHCRRRGFGWRIPF